MGNRDRGHTTTRARRAPALFDNAHDGDDDDLLRLRARQRAERLLLLLLRASRVRADALVAFAGGMLRPTRTRIGRRPRVRARREREVQDRRSPRREARDAVRGLEDRRERGEDGDAVRLAQRGLGRALRMLLRRDARAEREPSAGDHDVRDRRRGRDRRAHAGPGEEERRRDDVTIDRTNGPRRAGAVHPS